MAKPNGVVLFEGPSRIDGEDIVVIATGLKGKSGNPKTGHMVQTWILRADVSPMDALRSGADKSICGGCIHRPKQALGTTFKGRSCYVNPQGMSSVYRAYARGSYPKVSPTEAGKLAAGLMVRLGSYGDPAAVPPEVWTALLAESFGHTGYTHQWKAKRFRDVLDVCQVSADTPQDAEAAYAAGLGSFRVLGPTDEPLPFEVRCPASEEAGRVAVCAECLMCSGAGGKNVVINAHGIGAAQYKPRKGRALPVLN